MSLLQMKHICKSFSGVYANEDINLIVEKGEIHALLGENGAGKSTLMNILGGVLQADQGSISIDGQKVEFATPLDSLNAGVGFIHQELNLINDLAVYENMFISREIRKKNGLLDIAAMCRETQKVFERIEVDIDPRTMVRDLDASYKQIVEIARALMMNAKMIIMDEPTVAVDPQSRNKILEGIQKLNEQGSTIIYTSHYMEEVEQICTRIAIMDHGRVIASGTTEELKKMIKTGETISVEAILLEEKHLQDIRNLPHVFDVHYENQILTLRCTGAQHNLIRLLNYLQSQDIPFGQVSSQLPTLNDVFLEITGKELRD